MFSSTPNLDAVRRWRCAEGASGLPENTRVRALEAVDYAGKSSVLPVEIDPVAIDHCTRLMREHLISGDVAARKAYLSAIIDAVVVSEKTIRIMGSDWRALLSLQ